MQIFPFRKEDKKKMSDLKIPVRTSSKRKQGYEAEIEHLDSQMNRKRKGLVLKGSFNTTYVKTQLSERMISGVYGNIQENRAVNH